MIEISKYFKHFTLGELKIFTIDDIEFRTRYIPPGTFQMGAGKKGVTLSWWSPPHQVTITNGFYIMEDCITCAQYYKNSSRSDKIKATYKEATNFAEYLNTISNTVCKQIDENISTGWRLPTEAEWEYCIKIDKGFDAEKEYINKNYKHNFTLGIKGLINSEAQWCMDSLREYEDTFPQVNPFGINYNKNQKQASRGSLRISYFREERSHFDRISFRLIKCV